MGTVWGQSFMPILIIAMMIATGQSQILAMLTSPKEAPSIYFSTVGLNQKPAALQNAKQNSRKNQAISPETSSSLEKTTQKKIIPPLEESKPAVKKTSPQKKTDRFQPIILETAERYEIEPAIIKAIIMAESGFNPKASSHKGARGLMQLMPRTAEYLGVVDSFDPAQNIDGGVRYFKRLLKRFDSDVELALAAYNAGSRNVRKYGGVPPFKATKIYIKKVLKYYETFNENPIDSKHV